MSRLGAAVALLLLVAAVPCAASEPSLTARIEPSELTVGDRLELTVELQLPANVPPTAVTWPSWGDHLGPAEILSTGSVESSREGGGHMLEQRLQLTLFDTGTFTLPPIAVTLDGAEKPTTLGTEPLTVKVTSVLPSGDELPQPEPPAPPRRLDLGRRFWWLTAVLVTACLGTLAGLILIGGRRESVAREPSLSPLAELERALEALRAEPDIASLHAGASLALRRYLGRRLGFTAPESTTTEVHRALRRQRLGTELVRETVELLTACDMVKFARRTVDAAEARRRIDRLTSLGERIEAWVAPTSVDGTEPEEPLAEAS